LLKETTGFADLFLLVKTNEKRTETSWFLYFVNFENSKLVNQLMPFSALTYGTLLSSQVTVAHSKNRLKSLLS
jgi:hypothetical protein